MSAPARVAAGVPTGGQFAAQARGEALGVTLGAVMDRPVDAEDLSGSAWFHGSRYAFDTFAPGGPTKVQRDWNTSLGNHVAADRSTAAFFAGDSGLLYSVALDVRAAKRYDYETDMSHEAAVYLIEAGHRLECCDPQTPEDWGSMYEADPEHYDAHGFETDVLAGHTDDDRDRYWLGHLSDAQHRETAAQFREHLMDQGYDGIVYGNEFEGDMGNECAIAFDTTQSTLTRLGPPVAATTPRTPPGA